MAQSVRQGSPRRAVSTSQPPAVTSSVCSHCADSRPSLVVTVQPSRCDQLGVAPAGVDHRLDGEGHAWLQFHAGPWAAVMQHLGLLVEYLADAVATVLPHHGVVVALGVLLDHVPDVAEARAGPTTSMAV